MIQRRFKMALVALLCLVTALAAVAVVAVRLAMVSPLERAATVAQASSSSPPTWPPDLLSC